MKSPHKYVIVCLLLVNILLCIYTRIIGVSYDLISLVGTDPVRYAHQAKQIIEQGRMPDVDMQRSAPLGVKTSERLTLYPYVIAIIYHVGKLINIDFEQYIIILPVLLFVLTLLSTYLLVWRIFGHEVALLSVNILIFTPPILARTYAGFADRDGLVLLLSIWSFFFYVSSYIETGYRRGFYRLFSSLTMLCVGLTWEGVGLFVFIVTTVELIKIMVDESYDGRCAGLIALWVVPLSTGLLFFKFDIYSHLSQPYAFVAVIYPVGVLCIAVLLLIVQRISWLQKIYSIGYRVPLGFGVTLFLGLFSFPLVSDRLFKALVSTLTAPFGNNPIYQIIGELQKLGLGGWAFWPGAFLIPMTIGLFLISSDICETLKLHKYWTLASIQIIVFGTAFSRLASGQSNINSTENFFTLGVYFISLGTGILGLLFVFLHACLKRNVEKPSSIDSSVWVKIFMVVWTIGMLISLRSAIRFAYLFAVPCTILGSYAILWPFKQWVQRDKYHWLNALLAVWLVWQVYILSVDRMDGLFALTFVYVLLICITLFIVLTITRFLTKHTAIRKLSIVGLAVYVIALTALSPHIALGGFAFYVRNGLSMPLLARDAATSKALIWIRENTLPDVVIAARWEYGSWLNLLSDRTTIVDEQQQRSWIHMMAKHFFLASHNHQSALEFLKTHKADYLFLTRRNIEALKNIAREAGDPNSIDIPIFGNVIQKIHFEDEDTRMRQDYYRYWLPRWNWAVGGYKLTLGNKTYPPDRWHIASIYVQYEESEKTVFPVKAMIELNLNGTVEYITPQYIHYGDTVLYADEKNAFLPCTLLIESRGNVDPTRLHVVYLSPYVRSLLLIRLFLLNDGGDFFQRVYPISDTGEDFAAQVWKIHYPDTIEANPEYLRRDIIAPTDF